MPVRHQDTVSDDHQRALRRGLSPRAVTCLTWEFGPEFTHGEVIAKGTKYLMRIPNLGKKTVVEIVAWVRACNAVTLPTPSDPELEALFEDADGMHDPEGALRMALRAVWEVMPHGDRLRAVARMREVLHDIGMAQTPPSVPPSRAAVGSP